MFCTADLLVIYECKELMPDFIKFKRSFQVCFDLLSVAAFDCALSQLHTKLNSTYKSSSFTP